MSNFQPINPTPFLKSLIGKTIIVRLKWNKTQYKGTLVSIDNYMNLQLDQTYEIISESTDTDATKEELIGEIFIRCNNVLFIREYKEQQQPVDSKPIENGDKNGKIDKESVEEEEKVTNNEDIEIDKE
ncbi:small nuclear ribonucleoprotein F [Candida albicans L26]|nr:small nuclear ribonucleoprotein F [Candida albicans P94015]KGT67545.1 small nuclear ribonucleoprotein F [Candida albicans 12C]KGU06166.1 small nuclear ribonucleoprotein F [Candida albicans L26]KGU23445.1 small nuclear ribonucleoprotein F [Candida albicans P34048]KGU27499.1 small nuclear ribonucleoprotein F [Candida albicans P57055]KHC49552.1 small nuclear ribonucleoprotein F [Candida albicans P60002]KHC52021.1 small nuclear ribonucleoprotein F [Candida albicans P37039]KHC58946.1 small nuc